MDSNLSDKKILFLAGTLGQGGAERQLYYILKCLKTTHTLPSPELVVYTQGEFWEEPIRQLGVPIHFAGQQSSRLARLRRTIQLVSQLKPDWLFSMHFYTNTYAGAVGRITGVKSFGSIRNDGISEIKSAGPVFGRMHYFLPHTVVANSEHGRYNFERLLGKRRNSTVLTNAIDTDYFSFRNISQIQGPPTLLFVGRLEKVKRCDRFLALIKSLREVMPDVRGIIIGDGRLRKGLENQANELGLNDAIQFMGKVGDVRPWYSKSTLLVSTSDHEGTPNVVLEAMACGLPVLCIQFEGIEEVVKDRHNGLVAFDEMELIDKAFNFLNTTNRNKQLSEKARRTIESIYSIHNLSYQLIRLLCGIK